MIKKILYFTRSFFWVIPFCLFASSYLISYLYLQTNATVAPGVVGKSLQEALKLTASKKLSLRLIGEREDDLLPEGTIIQQYPKSHHKMRSNQAIFVTIAKKPVPIVAHNCTGKKLQDVQREFDKKNMTLRTVHCQSRFSSDYCIAQDPACGDEVKHRKVTVYVSQGESPLFVVPDFRGNSLEDALIALQEHDIEPELYDRAGYQLKHVDEREVIADQKPMPGSIVNLSKKCTMQLQIDDY